MTYKLTNRFEEENGRRRQRDGRWIVEASRCGKANRCVKANRCEAVNCGEEANCGEKAKLDSPEGERG